jgi:glucose/arabinose dehydrogenase
VKGVLLALAPALALLGVLWVAACDDDPATCEDCGGFPPPDYTYDLVDAFPNLTFSRPVDIQNAGDGTDRLFVVEQLGRIFVFPNDAGTGAATEFLDVTGRVTYTAQSEMGLLGLAFHPQYESNGYFYAYYITTIGGVRTTRLSRFQVSPGDPDAADAGSEAPMLGIADEFNNHNGGSLCFDGDGYLLVAIGDEGDGGDPNNNAQNRGVLYGKILRLDVNQSVNTSPYYGIPPDNPFAGNSSGYREEIYAYGMRNPWRISYDAATDRVWAGDVGQGAREEVDIIVSGGNYGWDCREGFIAYTGPPNGPSPACATASGFVDPVIDYPRSAGHSITGGYIYRGPTLTSLTGKYVYADFTLGTVWALAHGASVTNETLKDTGLFISTFGVAENGELLIAGYYADGTPTSLYLIQQTGVNP